MKNMVNEQQYNDLLTKSEFEAALRKIGKERYHDNCRFHHLLHNTKIIENTHESAKKYNGR